MSAPAGAGAGRRLTIVFNPVAGSGRQRALDKLVDILDHDGWRITVAGTNGPGHATDLAADAARAGEDVVAAAGGDGTISEVVRGLRGSQTPLGIVPLGTANVLAAELGIPRSMRTVARILADGLPRPFHLPSANGAPFLLMAGAGFDGAVVGAVTSRLKRRFGKGAFVLQGLRHMIRGDWPTMEVEIDGRVRGTAQWALVTNVVRYGGAYRLAPEPDFGEPELIAVLFEDAAPLALLRHLLAIGAGRVAHGRGVRVLRGARVRIAGNGADVPVQIDGDAAGILPLDVAATGDFIDILLPR
jgi:diacylglycerol kinase (ATP)